MKQIIKPNFYTMKKFILMVAAAMALIVPTATAQKINEDATLAKLTKSDAEVKDAKKAAKSEEVECECCECECEDADAECACECDADEAEVIVEE